MQRTAVVIFQRHDRAVAGATATPRIGIGIGALINADVIHLKRLRELRTFRRPHGIATHSKVHDQIERLIEGGIPGSDLVSPEGVKKTLFVGREVGIPFVGRLRLEMHAVNEEP